MKLSGRPGTREKITPISKERYTLTAIIRIASKRFIGIVQRAKHDMFRVGSPTILASWNSTSESGTNFTGLETCTTRKPARDRVARIVRREKKKTCCGGVINRHADPINRLRMLSQSPVVITIWPPTFKLACTIRNTSKGFVRCSMTSNRTTTSSGACWATRSSVTIPLTTSRSLTSTVSGGLEEYFDSMDVEILTGFEKEKTVSTSNFLHFATGAPCRRRLLTTLRNSFRSPRPLPDIIQRITHRSWNLPECRS